MGVTREIARRPPNVGRGLHRSFEFKTKFVILGVIVYSELHNKSHLSVGACDWPIPDAHMICSITIFAIFLNGMKNYFDKNGVGIVKPLLKLFLDKNRRIVHYSAGMYLRIVM